jgi:hypothetical protein
MTLRSRKTPAEPHPEERQQQNARTASTRKRRWNTWQYVLFSAVILVVWSAIRNSLLLLPTQVTAPVGPLRLPNGTCAVPRKSAVWKWQFHETKHSVSDVNDGSSLYQPQGRRRLLIAQFAAVAAAPNNNEKWLEATSKINQAYAEQWQHDYVLVTGSLVGFRRDEECEPPPERAKLNKVEILNKALKRTKYDQVLILDGSSTIYDFGHDITSLLSDDEMLAAQQNSLSRSLIRGGRAWEMDTHISLWNLRHSLTSSVAEDWRQAVLIDGPKDDQECLHEILQKDDSRNSQVAFFSNKFDGLTGTAIRRFDPEDADWGPIDESMGHVCLSLPSLCDNLYSKHRPPQWDWRYYGQNATTTTTVAGSSSSSPKMLIAQYSAFGTYAQLLERTSPLNKAYARMWHHDYVVLQGAAISIPRDAWYPPPEERSRFNKIALLQMAMAREYDMLLLLDADAMIYDFSKDLRNYLPQEGGQMLAAHRVKASDDRHTWDINNGVTLWNLKHPLTPLVVDDWFESTRKALHRNPTTRKYMLTGDQALLHGVLKIGDRRNVVTTYLEEFQYRNATVIKHFIRENLDWTKDDVWKRTSLDSRSINIEKAKQEVYQRFASACQDLEHTEYSK